MSDPITTDQIANWFGYHPATEETGPMHDTIRQKYGELAMLLTGLPSGPDRTLAVRKLQEAMWAANACIACNVVEKEPVTV